MSKRSVAITLVNNTPFTLDHFWEFICHGSWSSVTVNGAPATAAPNASLPETIPPNSIAQWGSADAEFSIGGSTATEGWVKYQVAVNFDPQDPVYELVWIHWDNPYIWVNPISGSITNPFDMKTSLTDVQETCGYGDSWPKYGIAASEGPLATQLFTVSANATGPPSFGFGSTGGEVWDFIVDWPGLIVEGLIDAERDINLQFTLGLRQVGSVVQSIRHFYDGSKGIRALATNAKQPSVRKLFGL